MACWWEGGSASCRAGVGSLLAALQELLEQRLGLAAQGRGRVQFYHPPSLEHQHSVRV